MGPFRISVNSPPPLHSLHAHSTAMTRVVISATPTMLDTISWPQWCRQALDFRLPCLCESRGFEISIAVAYSHQSKRCLFAPPQACESCCGCDLALFIPG